MTTTGPAHGADRDTQVSLADRYARLQRRYDIEVRLAESLGSGCDFAELFAAISALTDRALWLFDPAGQPVMCSVELPQCETPDIRALCAEFADRTAPVRLGIARTRAGVARRCLLTPVHDAESGEITDWLMLAEGARNIGGYDRCLLDRGRTYLARHRTLHRAIRRSAAEIQRGLVERLLRRSGVDRDPVDHATRIGIRAESTCIVVAMDDSVLSAGFGDIDALIAELGRLVDGQIFGARTARGPALIVDAGVSERVDDSRLIEDVCRALSATLPPDGVQCGVSGVVSAAAISDGYEEALEVVACLDRFTAEHTRILSVRDLGPARILVANGNIAAIRRYVEHVFGPLWTEKSDSDMETLMTTLAQFSRDGHNVRRTAAALSVHENTVRQRLARVRKQTGLDVLNDPFAQLSVHTALAIIALRNRAHPLWDPRARGLLRLDRLRHDVESVDRDPLG
nr:PucR family transcriptional regulator [Gordonia lacunae]